jgi:hypothetical protein
MLTVDRHRSATVAIDVRYLFEHDVYHSETYFRFRPVQQN